ncbi:RmlC-like cupin domain-containing protein [Aspergillus filifer]
MPFRFHFRFTHAITLSLLTASTLAIPTAPSSWPSTSSTPSTYPSPPTGGNGSDDSTNIDDMLPPIVPVNPRSGDKDLIQSLLLAPTQADRAALLTEPGDFIFDFNNPTESESRGKGGFSTAATAKTFPALIGNNAAMTLGFLGPCGMNTAHVHNRATELNVVVKGRLVTNFILENGVSPVENTMELYQMAVFPQGAIHQEFNPDCEETVFVAGFNSQDPGVSQVAQNFFGLRGDVVQATLGGVSTFDGKDLESFREIIPANIALGIEACLDKCGIQRNQKRDLGSLLAEM